MKTAKKPTLHKLPQISSAKMTYRNGAEANRVFLYENITEPPYVRPVSGWKIIGYGNAPWPGPTEGFAVMFEKQTPAEKHGDTKGQDFPEGTQIWQHYRREYLENAGEHTP